MKLLLVEDDMEISQMLKDYLETENYEVICAVDGEEACKKFDRDAYSPVSYTHLDVYKRQVHCVIQ